MAALHSSDPAEIAAFAQAFPTHHLTAMFVAVDWLIFFDQLHRLVDLAPLRSHAHWAFDHLWPALVTHHEGDTGAAGRLIEALSPLGPEERDIAVIWAEVMARPSFRPRVLDEAQPGPAILQFWDSREIPPDVSAAIDAWKDIAARRHVLFDAETAADFLRDTYGPREAAILTACPHPAIMCDYFRLGYLAAKGGLYVDADMRPKPKIHRQWGGFVDRTVLWVRTHVHTVPISNGFMAARVGSPIMTEAFAEAGRRLTDPGDRSVMVLAGPGMLRDVVAGMAASGQIEDFTPMTSRFGWARAFSGIPAAYKDDDRSWGNWMRKSRGKG